MNKTIKYYNDYVVHLHDFAVCIFQTDLITPYYIHPNIWLPAANCTLDSCLFNMNSFHVCYTHVLQKSYQTGPAFFDIADH